MTTDMENRLTPLEQLDELEAYYKRLVGLLEPDGAAEPDLKQINTYIRALQGLERCIKLRMAEARDADPEEEEGVQGDFSTIDLSQLSDAALREVEAALVRPGCKPNADPNGTRRKSKTKSNLLKTIDESNRIMNKSP